MSAVRLTEVSGGRRLNFVDWLKLGSNTAETNENDRMIEFRPPRTVPL